MVEFWSRRAGLKLIKLVVMGYGSCNPLSVSYDESVVLRSRKQFGVLSTSKSIQSLLHRLLLVIRASYLIPSPAQVVVTALGQSAKEGRSKCAMKTLRRKTLACPSLHIHKIDL